VSLEKPAVPPASRSSLSTTEGNATSGLASVDGESDQGGRVRDAIQVRSGAAMSTVERSDFRTQRAESGVPAFTPDGPVLRVGAKTWWESTGLDRSMAAAGWTWITADDAGRARWLASIRPVALVFIAGNRTFRWQALEAIRDRTGAPVAVMTDEPEEVVSLIDAGVDLVVPSTEPCETLLARLSGAIRNADARRVPGVRYLRANDLVVDLWTQQCSRCGNPISLSPTEYRLLTFLMTRSAVTTSTGAIIDRVWQQPPADSRNALCIVVNRLRHKLGDDPRNPAFIASVRGSGYRFIANVAEVADSLVDHDARLDLTPLFDSLAWFAQQLATAHSTSDAAEVLADALDRAGIADGMALFRNEGTRMRLVTARRLSDAWLESVADGVPLDPSFASAQSVLTGEVVQFADVRAVKERFRSTVRRLSSESFRACHFVPITRGPQTWGHLGLARHSASPLDATTMAYLRALSAEFLLRPEDGRRAGHDAAQLASGRQ